MIKDTLQKFLLLVIILLQTYLELLPKLFFYKKYQITLKMMRNFCSAARSKLNFLAHLLI